MVAWHVDQGVSGAAAVADRPGLLAALAALREHGAGVLVVAKRDRLARDVMAAAMVDRLTCDAGARVLSAAGEGTESDDPAAVLMRRMVDAFAEYERALIAARTRAASLSAAIRSGRSSGRPRGRSSPSAASVGSVPPKRSPSPSAGAVATPSVSSTGAIAPSDASHDCCR